MLVSHARQVGRDLGWSGACGNLGAAFVEDVNNREEVATILAAPDRIGVAPEVIRRTLDGRLKVSPDGTFQSSDRYLLIGRARAARDGPRATLRQSAVGPPERANLRDAPRR